MFVCCLTLCCYLFVVQYLWTQCTCRCSLLQSVVTPVVQYLEIDVVYYKDGSCSISLEASLEGCSVMHELDKAPD